MAIRVSSFVLKRFGICFWGLLVFLFSCSVKPTSTKKLIAIDSLVEAQVQYLSAQHANLTKASTLDGVTHSVASTPIDTTAWKKELEIFTSLGVINKPSNRAAYIIETQADSKSNLMVKTFTDTTNLPVAYIKMYYQGSVDKLRKIEAQYRESNSLYASTRFLTMEFQPRDTVTVLTLYTISGGQKMVMADSVQYTINATITLSK